MQTLNPTTEFHAQRCHLLSLTLNNQQPHSLALPVKRAVRINRYVIVSSIVVSFQIKFLFVLKNVIIPNTIPNGYELTCTNRILPHK